MGNNIIFRSSRVMSASNGALHITSVGWVVSLTLGAVLVTLCLTPPTGYASSPHGVSIDASCVMERSQFAYQVHVSYLQSPLALCSCSNEVES